MIDPTKEWFAKAGAKKPAEANSLWIQWMDKTDGRRTVGAKRREALRLATGLSKAAIGFFFSDPDKLSDSTCQKLARLNASLGGAGTQNVRIGRTGRTTSRIALFMKLSDVTAASFTLRMIEKCTLEMESRGIECTIHDLPTPSSEYIDRVIEEFSPQAACFVRQTLDTDTVEVLLKRSVPTVLIHPDSLEFGAPVAGIAVPEFANVTSGIRMWSRGLEQKGAIVVASMEPESLESLRQQRLNSVCAGLEGRSELFYVEDYSFYSSLDIVRRFPEASGYVCLSDDLAVGIKQILRAEGKWREGVVLGYDNSPLASKSQISSFDQNLEKTARESIQTLQDAWARPDTWLHTSRARVVKIPVLFETRS